MKSPSPNITVCAPVTTLVILEAKAGSQLNPPKIFDTGLNSPKARN